MTITYPINFGEHMATKIVNIKELIEKSCVNTPKLKCKLVAVLDKNGNRLDNSNKVEVIIECESK